MTTTTSAAILRDPDLPFTIEEVALGELGPRDVLVRVVAVGFCHTDATARTTSSYVLPAILGHEGSGLVAEVGSEVQGITPGDAVVLSFASCGQCAQCRKGVPAYCSSFLALNMTGRDLLGATNAVDAEGSAVQSRWFGQSSFAGYCIVNERSAVVIEHDLPLEIMGPLGCGIQTGAGSVLNEMKLTAGQSIAVFGAGAVGLAAIMAARAAGASDIVAIDLHQSRLDLALELGATRAVLATDKRLVERVVGDSEGLDFAFDTTGVGAVMANAIAVVGAGGEIVLVGASLDGLALHPSALIGKRVGYVLEGGADPQKFIPLLIGLWREGRFPFDRLVTKYPFADINVAEADSRSGVSIKPVLLLDES